MSEKNPFADPVELDSPAPDGAPPAYSPHNEAAVAHWSPSAPRPEAQAPRKPFRMSASTRLYQPFPASLNVYYRWKITRTFHLGDSADHKRYAASSWGEMGSKGPGIPCIMLHNGPSADDPVLAVSCEEKSWTFRSRSLDGVMVLPSLDAPSESVTELLRSVTSRGRPAISFTFSVEIAQARGETAGGRLRREEFEWRRIESKEKLRGFSNGFELFRSRSGRSSEDEVEVEVLAVVLFKGMLNVNKPLNFEFKGKGLTGELGDRWAVMALMTGIRIWFLFFSARAR